MSFDPDTNMNQVPESSRVAMISLPNKFVCIIKSNHLHFYTVAVFEGGYGQCIMAESGHDIEHAWRRFDELRKPTRPAKQEDIDILALLDSAYQDVNLFGALRKALEEQTKEVQELRAELAEAEKYMQSVNEGC